MNIFRFFIVAATLASGLAFAGLTDGLVGHWEFENNYNDTSGNGNNGTAYNSPTFVAGRFGQAVDLDGVNSTLSLKQKKPGR